MMRLCIWCLAVVAVLVSPALAEPARPAIGSFRADMTFAQVRSARPAIVWKSSVRQKAGSHAFSRGLYADDAVIFVGKSYDVVFSRNTDGVSELTALTYVAAATPKGCGRVFEQTLEMVATTFSVSPKIWVGSRPVGYSVNPYFWEHLDFFKFGFPIGDVKFDAGEARANRPVKAERSKAGAAFSLSVYKDARLGQDSQSWRSYVTNGNALIQVSGAYSNFHPYGSSAEQQCRIAISLVEASNKVGGALAEAISIDRSKLALFSGLGERYEYLTAKTIDSAMLSQKGYDCVLDASNGRLNDCNPTGMADRGSPASPDEQLDIVRGYMGLFKLANWQLNEDDLVQHPVHVAFSLDTSDKVPAFDWRKAKPETDPQKKVKLNYGNLITSEDYPDEAMAKNVSGVLVFSCIVLPDLSPYCGKMLVTPPENEVYFAKIAPKVQRRLRKVRVAKNLDDGEKAEGTYFTFTLRMMFPG